MVASNTANSRQFLHFIKFSRARNEHVFCTTIVQQYKKIRLKKNLQLGFSYENFLTWNIITQIIFNMKISRFTVCGHHVFKSAWTPWLGETVHVRLEAITSPVIIASPVSIASPVAIVSPVAISAASTPLHVRADI